MPKFIDTISESLFKSYFGSRYISFSNFFSWRQGTQFSVVFQQAGTVAAINQANNGIFLIYLLFFKRYYWVMFYFYNTCFGMISCHYNTAFSIHLLICLYKLVGFLLVLMFCTYIELFHPPFPLHQTIFSCVQFYGSSWFLFGWSMFLLWLLIIWEIFFVQL